MSAHDVMRCGYPSYHKPFSIAQAWLREGGSRRGDALALLTLLRRQYGHVLAIANELVLALLESDRSDEALAELGRVKQQFSEVDEETRCRWGRIYKQAGDRARQAADLVAAEEHYRQALTQYDQGFGIRQGHYPGINKATMLLLLAALARQRRSDERSVDYLRQATAMADTVLARREWWTSDLPDDNIWHEATLGEAELLKQNWGEAVRHYEAALRPANVQPFHRQSIGKQARRILDAWAQLGVRPERAADLERLFGAEGEG
jgi:tetratricopeptide (TPR) repeat protein